MTFARWLRRASLPGLAGMAMLAGAGTAFAAAGTLTYNGGAAVNYATQAITSSAVALTAPVNVALEGLMISAAGTPAGGTASSVTFTLPSGFTFATQPSFTCTPGTLAFPPTITAGTCVAGNNPIGTSAFTVNFTYVCTVANACLPNPSGNVLITLIGGWTFNNATPLSIPVACAAAFTINAKSGDPNMTATATGLNTNFACSTSALNFVQVPPTTTAFTSLAIDIGTGSLGKQFTQAGGAPTLTADLGGLIVGTAGVSKAADGVTPFSFAGGTVNVTIPGNFTGITGATLAPFTTVPTTTCPSSGGTVGTFNSTNTAITFTGVPIAIGAGAAAEVCLTAGGTTLIGPNAGGFAPRATFGNLPIQVAGVVGTGLNAYNFNGAVQQGLYLVSGNATYSYFARITNNTAAAQSTLVVVQPDTGTSGVATLASVAANTNVLLKVSDIVTSAGVTLDTTGRTSMLFLTKGVACVNNAIGPSCGVSVKFFEISPNGTLSEAGSGAAP